MAMTWISLVQPLGKERTDGPVDEPGGQGLVVAGGGPLRGGSSCRHAAGRVEHFLIVAGQGQEVHDPVQGLVGGRDQDHGVAPLPGDGAAGLQGHFAVFDDDFAVAHGDGAAGGLKCHVVPHAGLGAPGRQLRRVWCLGRVPKGVGPCTKHKTAGVRVLPGARLMKGQAGPWGPALVSTCADRVSRSDRGSAEYRFSSGSSAADGACRRA